MKRPFPIVNQKSLIINGETVRAETRYYPWGQDNRWKVNVTPTGARFTNQRLDDTLNLYNYNARYYDHWIGRFITADTIVPDPNIPQSINRYSYVLNSPLRYIDPSGYLPIDEIEDYFGYDENAALDAWGQELFDYLWDTELTWGDVFNYDSNNVMLVLFESGQDTDVYRGGFWGLDGDNRGEEVWEYELRNSDDIDYNPSLSEAWEEIGWANLPRKTGSDGRNNYDPTTYIDAFTIGTVSASASIAGLFFISGPAGWIAGGITIIGGGSAIYSVATDNLTVNYPVLRLPSLIGNAPVTIHAFSPQGIYR